MLLRKGWAAWRGKHNFQKNSNDFLYMVRYKRRNDRCCFVYPHTDFHRSLGSQNKKKNKSHSNKNNHWNRHYHNHHNVEARCWYQHRHHCNRPAPKDTDMCPLHRTCLLYKQIHMHHSDCCCFAVLRTSHRRPFDPLGMRENTLQRHRKVQDHRHFRIHRSAFDCSLCPDKFHHSL